MVFTIYAAPEDVTGIWYSGIQTIAVADGIFNYQLGSTNILLDHLFSESSTRYLGIRVEGEEILPRTQMIAVPYAFHSLRSDTAGNVEIPFSATGTEVEPIISGTNDGSGVGVRGEHSITSNYGYLGGSEYGVKGQFDTDNFGFLGSANYGVYGKHFSTGNEGYLGGSGLAVFGKHLSSGNEGHLGGSGNAVYGLSTSGYAGFFNGKVYVNGVVGIGETDPSEKLEVSGNIKASGTITSGNSITIDGVSDMITASGGTIDFDNENLVTTGKATIGPGHTDTGNNTFIAGENNTVTFDLGTVSGGQGNTAGGVSVVAGGVDNEASNQYASIGGGESNVTLGAWAAIPGGLDNNADGIYSFAAGRRAKANHAGSFVWSDQTDADFASLRQDQFRIQANGGARFDVNNSRWLEIRDDGIDIITTSMGAHLTIGGVWTNASDRNLKENFTEIDRQGLLNKIAELPITRWNFKVEGDAVTHIGPVAQDFYAIFGVGSDDKSVASMDEAGIALAAIQELHKKNADLETEVAELKALVKQLLEKR
jgi:hypothetical protein